MGKGSEGIEVLRAEVRSLGQAIRQHDKVLLGNGRAGLVQTVAKLEGVVMGLAATVKKIEGSSIRMELSATKTESYTSTMAGSMTTLQKRISDVEKLVKPIINWKRDIVLRLTTIGATVSVIFGAAWWMVEHFDKIKELFQ